MSGSRNSLAPIMMGVHPILCWRTSLSKIMTRSWLGERQKRLWARVRRYFTIECYWQHNPSRWKLSGCSGL